MTTLDFITYVDKDEHMKYRMWSNYVAYMTSKWNGHEDGAERTDLMTYFQWLDHFGLS